MLGSRNEIYLLRSARCRAQRFALTFTRQRARTVSIR